MATRGNGKLSQFVTSALSLCVPPRFPQKD
jgi:hypothetical protein